MNANRPLLDVRGLSVAFGDKTVVHGVDFSIGAGEKLALVGESGSGKTVTALALLRLAQNARLTGSALLAGAPSQATNAGAGDRDLLAVSEREMLGIRGSDIAMIFQEPMTALNPLYTVGDQVAEVLQLKRAMGRREAWEAAVEALAATGIPDPARRAQAFPHQLSGGQRQRAMIAMALACDPKILVADEPTTALDVTIQKEIMDLLARLRRERGMSIILITHNFGIVANFADKVQVMWKGRIVESGPVAQVMREQTHPYTKALIACIPRLGQRRRRLTTLSEELKVSR
jgi:microcin C transport system ATP-binding protein